MSIVKISEEKARQNAHKLYDLLAEYDQHIRNDALKILRNLYFTEVKKQLSCVEKDTPYYNRIMAFAKESVSIQSGHLFDFETAIDDFDALAQKYELDIHPAIQRGTYLNTSNEREATTIYQKDLLAIKQKQDGIKRLKATLKNNEEPFVSRLEDFVEAYQAFNGPAVFAQRRHQDGTLHNFWKAVDAILTKLGFGVSTTGVTGAKVDKKIWGMFEKAGVKKADMEVEQRRRHVTSLGI